MDRLSSNNTYSPRPNRRENAPTVAERKNTAEQTLEQRPRPAAPTQQNKKVPAAILGQKIDIRA